MSEIGINYRHYPECMLAAFLPPSEGVELRRVAGNVVFKSVDKNGNTYKNGALHSYDDQPALSFSIINYYEWDRDGILHRDGDKPAWVHNMCQKWYLNGKLHREGDQPAIIDGDNIAWYKNVELHREGDLPAMIYNKNLLKWYKNGKLHREGDQPAVIDGDYTGWFKYGKLHREGDLPAIIQGIIQEWWVNGILHR